MLYRSQSRWTPWGMWAIALGGLLTLFGEAVQDKRVEHWAFQPIPAVEVPSVPSSDWARQDLDYFILEKAKEFGLKAGTAPVDRRTWLRRVTFDLTGLPPAPEDVKSFLDDSSPDADVRVVDRLLGSEAYGERWGRHWLDVARYADTAGETADYPLPEAWRYRNYVIDSFNSDKPYDQFIREQVAGDILAREGDPALYSEQVVATGFLALSRRFGFDSENYHHLTIQDTLDTLGQAVMGLSLGCARCHDHKYDPISMREYYGLYGIFESTRYSFPGSEQKQKFRSLVSLEPPGRALEEWRRFSRKAAAMKQGLAEKNESVPHVVLRSLESYDGDFEFQAIAAGGSRGVLVPPWRAEGSISVTREAQSPFRDFYFDGQVGVHLPEGPVPYWIFQEIHSWQLGRPDSVLRFSVDFRITQPVDGEEKDHRIWFGETGWDEGWPLGEDDSLWVLRINSQEVNLEVQDQVVSLGSLEPGKWYQVALAWNRDAETLSARKLVEGGAVTDADPISLARSRMPQQGGIGISSNEKSAGSLCGMDLDQIALFFSHEDETAFTGETRTLSESQVTPSKEEWERMMVAGPVQMAYGVVEGTPKNAQIHLRGDPEKPGETVPRGFLSVLAGTHSVSIGMDGSGRRELADWLTNRDHPLTARVMVNRIWQHHFGQGLVGTPNDFGLRGQRPSHPALLDYLAGKFMDSGWSVKSMHRMIVLSATYWQGNGDEGLIEKFLAFPRRRLSAEEIRDSLLWVSGSLKPRPEGGHPFPQPTRWGFTQHGPFIDRYDHESRSVYLMTQRIKRHPLLSLFDGPDPNASTGERRLTTVPTQALFFMNDPLVHEHAMRFARASFQAGGEEPDWVKRGYERALGRGATVEEVADGVRFLSDYESILEDGRDEGQGALEEVKVQALSAFYRILLSSNEFIHVD